MHSIRILVPFALLLTPDRLYWALNVFLCNFCFKLFLSMRFEVLTVVTMRSTGFLGVASCILVKVYRYFKGMYCLHPQD
jgi:hypothetical protein